MPVDLADLAAPDHAAVVVMEMQRGIVGDLAALPELAGEVAARDVVGAIVRLLGAARQARIPVVHCIVCFRPDGVGSATNAPLLRRLRSRPAHLLIGSAEAEVIPALGPAASDLVEARSHGVSPFGGTSLDATLRNLGASTVVTAGVSVNLGIVGLAIEAVNLGYEVVVAQDAVAGVPAEYARSVVRNTIGLVATLATVEDLTQVWVQRRAQMQE